MDSLTAFATDNPCTWCPGCGNFGIWLAFKEAAVRQGWNNFNTVMVAGIGCHGHLLNFLGLTAFEGLHGRPIPVAAGIKMANPKLNVFVFTGDGDCLGEGGNHFIHAARRNHNLTVILHDNAVYALTTGQTSPRSPRGFKSKSTPEGNPADPLHPLPLAWAAGATWLARAYAGDLPALTELIIQANQHPGFAVIQVLQPCVAFNHVYTHEFFQKNTYLVGPNYDPTDAAAAWHKLQEWGEQKIPLGLLFAAKKPAYEDPLPRLTKNPPHRNLTPLLRRYR
ncbi:MAG: 2-oxoacid ferredoxin oxidoreductase [Candidatus Magasanikbacteria bacterium]|nr:2-oxoacid ferredoxin oxidoreductase [Candidatus Magasanikbacteria bacterium]